jgi:UDP-N-acetylmuramoyl-L-alanyl-D-glutamate--2,6-diaminopimelate ligase
MEVSSHALVQQRVAGTVFATVAFTNLSRDHLDYHASMEEYFKAKASLFTAARARVAVIDVDGPYGRLLASTTDIADVIRTGASQVDILEVGAAGSQFRWRGQEVHLPLGGRFNIANAAVAAEVAVSLGIAPEVVAAGLATTSRVPGRFEQVEVDAPYRVVVDYAHTPDGLEHVLAAAREVAGDGRVLVVFGCGGERDTTKRPLMGRAAEEGADVVVVTSDNPRSEDPERIIGEVLTGFERRPWLVEPDRRAAIRAALGEARPGDIVVIAGKGHETTQEIGTRVQPFDDRAVAALEARQVRGGA